MTGKGDEKLEKRVKVIEVEESSPRGMKEWLQIYFHNNSILDSGQQSIFFCVNNRICK